MLSSVFIWRISTALAVFVSVSDQNVLSRKLERKVKRSSQNRELRPWEINQGVCPPSLCPPPPIAQTLMSEPINGEMPLPDFAEPNPYPFFEGDIVLGRRIKKKMRSKRKSRGKRAAVRGLSMLWEHGIVPFTVDKKLSSKVKKYIKSAHAHISSKTCITFRAKTKDDKNYVKYVYEPGCWSYIGVQKGAQRVALGHGCDKFGTVVHETAHALGFWHEQSRKDRDKFVTVVDENIAPSAKINFHKLTKKVQNSRGYPYDYRSIMHYADDYFSINGRPTLKLKGVGKAFGFEIGQRLSLSELDIAQLRDMYQCNKPAQNCPKGWMHQGPSCYKFVLEAKQFAGAQKHCTEARSSLVTIDSLQEDTFLSQYIAKTFPDTETWRTGGKRYDANRWIWHNDDPRYYRVMGYTNFASGHPGKHTTLVFQKDDKDKTFKWHGTWAGSINQLPKYAHPFICEQKANDTCTRLRYRDGRDYRGTLDFTVGGTTCQKWSSQYPHQHSTYSKNPYTNAINGLVENNYCRNPSTQRRERPWCYTTKTKKKWEYCDIRKC